MVGPGRKLRSERQSGGLPIQVIATIAAMVITIASLVGLSVFQQKRIAARLEASEYSPERCVALARLYANFRILEEESRLSGNAWSEADRSLDALAGCPADAIAREVAGQTASLAARQLLARQKTADIAVP